MKLTFFLFNNVFRTSGLPRGDALSGRTRSCNQRVHNSKVSLEEIEAKQNILKKLSKIKI
jgi:hypothetical protein